MELCDISTEHIDPQGSPIVEESTVPIESTEGEPVPDESTRPFLGNPSMTSISPIIFREGGFGSTTMALDDQRMIWEIFRTNHSLRVP
jgi:hypothetical protein